MDGLKHASNMLSKLFVIALLQNDTKLISFTIIRRITNISSVTQELLPTIHGNL